MSVEAFQMRESGSGRELLGDFSGQVPVWDDIQLGFKLTDYSVMVGEKNVLDYLTPGRTLVQAINAALADTAIAATGIYFPPGDYPINGPCFSNVAGKWIRFLPGAELVMDPNGLGSLTMNGQDSQIVGDFVVRWDTASNATYVAIDLHGSGSECDQVRFEINANVPNCILFRLSGDSTQLGSSRFTGSGGSFKYGVELSHQDGTSVRTARAGLMTWEMVDDGVNTRNFSAWLRYRSVLSQCGPLRINIGGRHFFNSIVEVDGQHNSLLDPQIKSSAASNFGILQKDDAEFFHVYDGEISGNFLPGSVGIASGDGSKLVGTPAVGHLKLYGTRITNWDINWRITGSADTPELFGATLANPLTADIVIDSLRGGTPWPTSALGLYGVYTESPAVPGAKFLWLKSGQLQGGIASSCEIGCDAVAGAVVIVEPGMSSNSMEFHGCRFPMDVGCAVTQPNVNSTFYFGGAQPTSGSNALGKGAFADKAIAALDPILTGLVIGTKDPAGTSNNHLTRWFTDIYTANFGNVAAGATVLLNFAFTGVPTVTTAELSATFANTLGAKATAGIIFQWWIDGVNTIAGTATNITGATINAVSGGVRFRIAVYG